MSSLFWRDDAEGFVLTEVEKLSSAWTIPDLTKLPSHLEGLVAFDVETKDDGISSGEGAGWPWGGGYVVGISFCADNWRGYLPIQHAGGGNLDREKVIQICRIWLGNTSQPKVGANVLYDLGWLKRLGVEVQGPVYDVQWAEAMLDEHQYSYSLERLARSYLQEGKDESLLQEAASAWGLDAKSGLWQLPSVFVGPYAEADADRTRRIFLKQKPMLEAAKLWDLFLLECSLLPLYLDMRWRGVRVDLDKAAQLKVKWQMDIQSIVQEVKRQTGIAPEINSPESLAPIFDQLGLKYNRTAKTKAPSITAEWLEAQDHPIPKMIHQARQLDKLVGTFIEGFLIGHNHNSRIYTEYHPLRSDDGGTISGRLSSSNPNLQQIPSRTEEGKHIRKCFLPEDGELWYSCDYSQQEPRLTVHYAAKAKMQGRPLPGALEAVQKYKDNPRLSYHQMVADETGLPYKAAKALNLALTYGRGVKSTAQELKITEEEAKKYIATYHERVPFVKALDRLIGVRVERDGELRTLLGRLCRFPLWEPADWEKAKKVSPKTLEAARTAWPGERLRRAWLHKKLNRLIQGSAADQTKKAMKNLWDAGLGTRALLQIHDEICFSFGSPDQAKEAARLMIEAVSLEVPTIVDIEVGPSWGDCKDL